MPTDPGPSARALPRHLVTVGLVALVAGLGSLTWAFWPRDAAAPVARSSVSVTPVDQSGVDAGAYARQLRAAADDARAAAGLPRFGDAACAQPVALARASALVGRPLEHAPLNDVRAACPASDVVAENLSRAQAAPADVVVAWMASPGHRSNLLDPTLTGMVVACTHDGPQMLCSQLFTGSTGTPTP